MKAMEQIANRNTKQTAVINSGTVHVQKEEKVSCWMDIVSGDDPNNRPIDEYLTVGQEATLVIKVNQLGNNH